MSDAYSCISRFEEMVCGELSHAQRSDELLPLYCLSKDDNAGREINFDKA